MSKNKSNNRIVIPGIIHVSGEVGVGKTTFALQAGAEPSRIAFFNGDVKPLDFSTSDLGLYRDYSAMPVLPSVVSQRLAGKKDTGGDPVMRMVEAIVRDLMDMEENQFDLIIFDGYEIFMKNLMLFVQKYPHLFKDKENWFATVGKFRTMELRGYTKVVEAGFLSLLQKVAGTVILITHMNKKFVDDEAVGMASQASDSLIKKSNVRLVLRSTPGHVFPTALVTKNYARHVISGGRIRTVQVLPEKLSLFAVDGLADSEYPSLWSLIEYYDDNPIGVRKPSQWEKMDAEDRAFVRFENDEFADADAEKKLNARVLMESPQVMSVVSEMIGKPTPAILARLKNVSPDITLEMVNDLLSYQTRENAGANVDSETAGTEEMNRNE